LERLDVLCENQQCERAFVAIAIALTFYIVHVEMTRSGTPYLLVIQFYSRPLDHDALQNAVLLLQQTECMSSLITRILHMDSWDCWSQN
ncbi:MAG: hypothetical protein RLY58_1988, partial [Pseudomonadota bacterium]